MTTTPTPDTDGGVRYPDIHVQLTGTDGNAFSVMANVKRALLRANVSPEEISAYVAESMSGDYHHLLATAMRWVQWS